jgi:hypothetical protein
MPTVQGFGQHELLLWFQLHGTPCPNQSVCAEALSPWHTPLYRQYGENRQMFAWGVLANERGSVVGVGRGFKGLKVEGF